VTLGLARTSKLGLRGSVPDILFKPEKIAREIAENWPKNWLGTTIPLNERFDFAFAERALALEENP